MPKGVYIRTAETRQHIREARLGTHLTEVTKEKIGLAGKGHIGYMKGKKHSTATKQKTSNSMKGKQNCLGNHLTAEHKRHIRDSILKQMPIPKELRMKMALGKYRGGKKASYMRADAKRRLLGHENLNEPFEGSVGHHIDPNHVVFIPRWLHKSVWHGQRFPETMEQINENIVLWLLVEQQKNMGEKNGECKTM